MFTDGVRRWTDGQELSIKERLLDDSGFAEPVRSALGRSVRIIVDGDTPTVGEY